MFTQTNMPSGRALLAASSVAVLLGLTGCGSGVDSAVLAKRTQYLRTEEPAGATSFADARQTLDEKPSVVLVGRISAGDQEPFVQGQAAFTLTDAFGDAAHGGDGGHDPANCPFCKRRASQPESKAIVQFLDEQGKVVPIDARELFDLKPNQVVVIEGEATVDPLNVMFVAAKAMHVRP
ncbi:MAG: hypothetical protein KF708_01340 [Pirellulales bacterium]|nr:hypothetical protein [Pirellulales bacterium]